MHVRALLPLIRASRYERESADMQQALKRKEQEIQEKLALVAMRENDVRKEGARHPVR